jgi:lipopolysaccharide biosynthesis glycosyltransferase
MTEPLHGYTIIGSCYRSDCCRRTIYHRSLLLHPNEHTTLTRPGLRPPFWGYKPAGIVYHTDEVRMRMENGMDILCACDERYLPHTATMLCSLLERNPGATIHIFHSVDDNRKLLQLKSFVRKSGGEVASYQMSPALVTGLRVDKWISIAAYYRLLAPRVLPKNLMRVLYLDSDIVVRSSLSEIWNVDLAGQALAAVEDFARPRTFNSGVLLINLRFWRQNNVAEQAVAFARNNPEKVPQHDQDALNAVVADRWYKLPKIWNDQLYMFKWGMKPLDAAVIHYCADVKPWHWSWNFVIPHPLKYEYHRYRSKTPWRRYRLREGRAVLPWRFGFVKDGMKNVLPSSVRERMRSLRIRLVW